MRQADRLRIRGFGCGDQEVANRAATLTEAIGDGFSVPPIRKNLLPLLNWCIRHSNTLLAYSLEL
jgi:hypothetical protein